MQNTKREQRLDWVRTGKTFREQSFNGKGIVTSAEEATVSGKRRTRIVQIEYTSNFTKEKTIC